jgi:hypothetical protein
VALGRIAWRARHAALVLAASLALAGSAAAQVPPPELARFLSDNVGLNESQIAAVEQGEAVAQALDTKNKRDIAIFGMVAVELSRESYLETLLDFQHSFRRPSQTQFGLFGTPAADRDVATLTIDRKDLADARTCEPGNCAFKLPAEAMQRLRQAIDWSAADPGAQADELMRRRLVEYVNDYRLRGDSAMVVYDDRRPVRASDAFEALLSQSPYVYRADSILYRYLARYPREPLDAAHEAWYWSVDSLAGLRPILMVNHVVIYSPPGAPFSLAAEKQIYANHYFEAALDLLAIVDRVGADGRAGIYLLRLTRYRFDNMPSIPLANVRGKAVKRFRDLMRADLERAKANAESPAR